MEMGIREALYTTRAMRRLKPDPIPLDVQARILDAAIRAPSAGNGQNWRFLYVDDKDLIARIAPVYRELVDELFTTGAYGRSVAAARANPDEPRHATTLRMMRAVRHQAEHWEAIPLLLFGFYLGDRGGSSIYPAIWSAMLAARAEGIGSTLTTILGSRSEVAEMLGVPLEQGWRMACCVPMGYPTGTFGVPARRPAHEVAGRNRWDGAVGFEVEGALWP